MDITDTPGVGKLGLQGLAFGKGFGNPPEEVGRFTLTVTPISLG